MSLTKTIGWALGIVFDPSRDGLPALPEKPAAPKRGVPLSVAAPSAATIKSVVVGQTLERKGQVINLAITEEADDWQAIASTKHTAATPTDVRPEEQAYLDQRTPRGRTPYVNVRREVLAGKSNKQIADSLGISPRSVDTWARSVRAQTQGGNPSPGGEPTPGAESHRKPPQKVEWSV